MDNANADDHSNSSSRSKSHNNNNDSSEKEEEQSVSSSESSKSSKEDNNKRKKEEEPEIITEEEEEEDEQQKSPEITVKKESEKHEEAEIITEEEVDDEESDKKEVKKNVKKNNNKKEEKKKPRNAKKAKKQNSKKSKNKKKGDDDEEMEVISPDTDSESEEEANLAGKKFSGKEFVQLSWKDLTYKVPKKVEGAFNCCKQGEETTIINGISGFVEPGSMLAILGPSGAGKTSLLNLLSMRIKQQRGNTVTGAIKINGEVPTRTKFRKISGFVAQDDILMGSQTPWEALNMTAKLTLGGEDGLSESDIEDKVRDLLKEMGLWHVKDNFIGYVGAGASKSGIKRGLSGGERKRVSVCVELIHDPKILFLDEPTSGLDSFAARAVVDCLRAQANNGRTIVCTIHQPSAEIFKKFDKVLILAAGSTIYLGPTKEAGKYFKQINQPIPPFTNPADHMIKIVQVPPEEAKKEGEGDDVEAPTEKPKGLRHVTKKQVETLIDEFNKSKFSDLAENPPEPPAKGISASTTHKHAPPLWAFQLLLERSMKNVWREPMLFKTRMFQTIFMGLLSGLIFLRLKLDLTGSGDRISAGFFIVMNQMFGSINGPSLLFPQERSVFFRERGSGLYTTLPYYIAKLTSEIPVNLLAPIVAGAISWWMIGFNDKVDNFALFLLVIVILSNIGYGLGILLNVVFLDPAVVNRVQPLVLLPFMLFAGFFVNLSSIPNWLSWLQYISFVKYSFRTAINLIMDGLVFTCAEKDLRPVPGILLNFTAGFGNVTGVYTTTSKLCFAPTGADVLNNLGVVDGYNFWADIFTLLGFLVFFLLLGFIILHFRKPKI